MDAGEQEQLLRGPQVHRDQVPEDQPRGQVQDPAPSRPPRRQQHKLPLRQRGGSGGPGGGQGQGEGQAGGAAAQVQEEDQQGAGGQEQDADGEPRAAAALQGPRHHADHHGRGVLDQPRRGLPQAEAGRQAGRRGGGVLPRGDQTSGGFQVFKVLVKY